MNNIITAERLKQLRESKGLSHKKLSQKLQSECQLTISDKQLMYYESAAGDEYHSKANTIYGMAIKTLFALAKFYNVSADYILGLTDIQTSNTNLRSVCEYIGLSSDATELLHSGSNDELPSYLNDVINLGCKSTYVYGLFRNILYYLKSNNIDVRCGEHRTNMFDLGSEHFDINDYKQITTLLYTLSESAKEVTSLYSVDKNFWEAFFLMSVQTSLSKLKLDLEKIKSNKNGDSK